MKSCKVGVLEHFNSVQSLLFCLIVLSNLPTLVFHSVNWMDLPDTQTVLGGQKTACPSKVKEWTQTHCKIKLCRSAILKQKHWFFVFLWHVSSCKHFHIINFANHPSCRQWRPFFMPQESADVFSNVYSPSNSESKEGGCSKQHLIK